MLEDSGADLLLSDHDNAPTAWSHCTNIIVVDTVSTFSDKLLQFLPSSSVSPDSLLYIMYTSGSTGKPKGVEILHKGIVGLVFGDYACFGPGEIFLHMSTLSFDASTFEIWV